MKNLVLAIVLCLSAYDTFAQNFVSVVKLPITAKGATSWASGWGDYDNDGDIDLYVCNYYNANYLFRNNGNGTFTTGTGAPVTSTSVGHWASTWVDYDNDNDLDLFVINSYTDNNELFRNNGNGTFTSVSSTIVTKVNGIDSNAAAWADTDNDGDLDVFISNGSNSDATTRNENNSYYINNGNGTFSKNTTSIIATDGGFSQFASSADYDNDGDADLIVINTFQDSFFYENTGHGNFVKKTGLPFLKAGEQPLTACWGDFNNDRHLDLVIGSYQDSRIYFNNGDKTFRTASFPAISGNAIGCSLGDFNLDGYLDVIFVRVGQAALYYLNNGDETFTKTNAGDLTAVATDFAQGGSVGDYDNDGDLDLFVSNDDSNNLLFQNTEVTGNWFSVKLKGAASNAQGVGAKVKIKVNGKWQMREVGIGSGYRMQNSINAHFGLGAEDTVDLVRIDWPSGNIQVVHNIKANQTITLTETNTPDEPHTMDLSFETPEDKDLIIHGNDFLSAFFDDEGDTLKSIRFTSMPDHGQLWLSGALVPIDSILSIASLDGLLFNPEPDFDSVTNILYDVIDDRGLSVGFGAHVNVVPVNDAPIILPIEDVSKEITNTGETVVIDFDVQDVDTPQEDLEITATSDNENVVSTSAITITGTTHARKLNAILTGDFSGSAHIFVKVSDGFLSDSDTFQIAVDVITAVEKSGLVVAISAYPNPSHHVLTIKNEQLTGKTISYVMMNNQGTVVETGEIDFHTDGTASLDIRCLQAGMYFLSCKTQASFQRVLKFIKD